MIHVSFLKLRLGRTSLPVLLVALSVSQLVPHRVFMCPTRFQVIPEGTEQVKIFAHANRMLDFWDFPLKK